MKHTFLTLALLAVCSAAAMAQVHHVEVNVRRYLDFDGQLYPMDLRGLRYMNQDFREYQPALHPIVNAEYERLRQRRNWHVALGVAGMAGGTAILYAGLPNATKSDPLSTASSVVVTTIAGTLLFAGGTAAILLARPRERDFLNLINQVNRASTGEKLRLSLYSEAVPGTLAVGASLRYRF